MSDDLTLKLAGVAVSGWTQVRVTRGVEHCPNTFQISATDRAPDVQILEGSPCEILIGSDKVITGYVDRVIPALGPRNHALTIVGRSKCQDLLDASAEWPGGQIVGANALEIAQKLAKPYGITASSKAPAGPQIPQFNLSLGETGYSIIERVARYAQLLVYEDVEGNLVLDQLGTDSHSSGFQEGVNVQNGSATYAMDQRFSEYHVYLVGTDTFQDAGTGGNEIAQAFDANVKRNRKLYLIADANQGGRDLALRRAIWEASRRLGRGTAITVEVDTWRDSAGKLWTPNTLVHVDVPTCRVKPGPYVITEVSYLTDEEGTRAEVTVMPKGALLPEPVQLQPQILDSITPGPAPR